MTRNPETPTDDDERMDLESAIVDDTDAEADADERIETDGGVGTPFEVVSEYEETRRDRYRKLYDAYIYTPISIIWRDWRARIGFTIVAMYLLMGTVGTMFVEPTTVTEGTALVAPFENMEYPLGRTIRGETCSRRRSTRRRRSSRWSSRVRCLPSGSARSSAPSPATRAA
ncbi:hypothetical protein [Natrinema sp. SYSU A 869]|uniref:hypothetical protein n=1 Tax=Natrinema sp. SYSU A 869 TaxID=2871694 RepID=UPI002102BB02|nr:hypothetical protein [Natrinema sp. SYSU A 869]